jgi:23S rRNA (guanosine2251-2'-O)-methyltransferase
MNPAPPRRRPPARSGGPTLAARLGELAASGATPCFLAVDELHYGQNLAALLRLADAGQVHGLVLPPSRSHPGANRTVRRMAGAACDRVPIHREGLMSALTTLRRAGVLVVGAAEDGSALFDEVDYAGATAFVLGGEDKGVSSAVRKKCDVLVRLPMTGRVPSLNVAATAAVLVFERLRQQRAAAAPAALASEVAPPAPEVSAAGAPEVSAAGAPEVSAAGAPEVSAAGAPEAAPPAPAPEVPAGGDA